MIEMMFKRRKAGIYFNGYNLNLTKTIIYKIVNMIFTIS